MWIKLVITYPFFYSALAIGLILQSSSVADKRVFFFSALPYAWLLRLRLLRNNVIPNKQRRHSAAGWERREERRRTSSSSSSLKAPASALPAQPGGGAYQLPEAHKNTLSYVFFIC